jgi:putative hemolysin
MFDFQPRREKVSVRLATTAAEIEAAQKLRYKVFYEECAAVPNAHAAQNQIDQDDYDAFADHLIVVDTTDGVEQIVGTYRLIRQECALKYGHFYSSGEYDLTPLLDSGSTLLELGRSCVLAQYRSRPILNLLWQGIADYVADNGIEIMFGCASLHGTDIRSIARPLSYLYHYHLAPEPLRPRAIKGRYINMNLMPKEDINPREAFNELPPLIKGYIRVGGAIGDGAVIDSQFNTTDVCIVMQTKMLTKRYRKHYERKIQKPLTGGEEDE